MSDAVSAHHWLARREPVFARLIKEYGHQDPFVWHDGGRTGSSLFAAMLLHITGQRISAVAGFTLFDRIADATGGIPTAESVAELGFDRLRASGLSGAKAACAVALATAQCDGAIDMEALRNDSDQAVIDALTAIRGIGAWSALAFLMRQLHRPDILPPDDKSLRQAVKDEWSLPEPPTPGQLRDRAARWSPCRSYASALLWRSLKPLGEISDPKARALRQMASARRGGSHF